MVIHELLLTVVVLGTIILGPYHNHIAAADDSMTKPGCQSFCGNLSIPYPFGLSDSDPHCCIKPSFTVDCDSSTNPPVLYLENRTSNIEVLHISVKDHELRIKVLTGRDCYNSSEQDRSSSSYPWLRLAEFPLSSTKNKFTAVGCDTLAIFRDRYRNFSFGCMSLCSNPSDVSSGSCSGIGCCQTSIPRNIFGYNISVRSISDHSDVLDFNPRSYAFVAETNFYNFSVGDLSHLKFNQSALVLDWAIGKKKCKDAEKNRSSYMCTKNSICTNAENGSGYKCTCLDGYRGNPYLKNGCHDIDECADPEMNQCEKICHNVIGNYTCSCPKGFHGDGKKRGGDGQGCIANPSHLMKILIAK